MFLKAYAVGMGYISNSDNLSDMWCEQMTEKKAYAYVRQTDAQIEMNEKKSNNKINN